MTTAGYYTALGDGRFQPTDAVQGAWHDHEQHMSPVSGLMVHAIEQHEPRPGMRLARVAFDILGVIPAEPSHVAVATLRPGRTIELVEATMVVRDRPVVRARAWRLAAHDSAGVAGGAPEPLPPASAYETWDGTRVWKGRFIASLETRASPDNVPGRGQAWTRTRLSLIEGVPVSPTAAFVGLLDTANGLVVREDPLRWMFPNVDLTIHLFREPAGGPGRWVGFDTSVVFGADGLGLASSTLHDEDGPVGRAEQSLTVREIPAPVEA